jgi:hypothetical protein
MSRVMMGPLALLVLVGCAGVPKPGVRDATTAIATQVELARASLAKCRAGEAVMCDQVERNLGNIASTNDELAALADDQRSE